VNTMNNNRRRDLAVIETDKRGNPRHLIVIPDDEERAEIIEVEAAQLPTRPAATSRVVAEVTGSYQDRARGFSTVTFNLSLVTGVGLVVAALVLRDGVTFAALTGVFFAGFCLVWLISFLLHTFISPEGVEIFETWQYWQFIRAEQQERWRRHANTYTRHSIEERGPNILTVGQTVILLAILAVLLYMRWGG
jgi:hypothetical protein